MEIIENKTNPLEGLDKLVTKGGYLLNGHDASETHDNFNNWVSDISKWLNKRFPDSGLSADWAAQGHSDLVTGSYYDESPKAWTFFKNTVNKRLRWLGNLPQTLKIKNLSGPALPQKEEKIQKGNYSMTDQNELVNQAISKIDSQILVLGNISWPFDEFSVWKDRTVRMLSKLVIPEELAIINNFRTDNVQVDRLKIEKILLDLKYNLIKHPEDFLQECDKSQTAVNNIGPLTRAAEKAKTYASQHIKEVETNSYDYSKVFIVHGRDNLAKEETARFVENLGLSAIILHEQASSGDTIIEKLEKYTNVKFAIVLYTPCDVGGLDDKNLKSRARQNVVFEHGYLIGKLHRKNVCALVKGDIEIPTDIRGIVYIPLDSHGAWKMKLANELNEADYKIDKNRIK